jgi:hypothetical protein
MRSCQVSDVSILKEDSAGCQSVHIGRMNIRRMVFERD